MATCVKLLPTGQVIGKVGTNDVVSDQPIIVSDAACTSGLVLMAQDDLKLQVSPEPTDPQRVADMYELFLAFMVVFAMVWGVKQLRRVFGGDMERD